MIGRLDCAKWVILKSTWWIGNWLAYFSAPSGCLNAACDCGWSQTCAQRSRNAGVHSAFTQTLINTNRHLLTGTKPHGSLPRALCTRRGFAKACRSAATTCSFRGSVSGPGSAILHVCVCVCECTISYACRTCHRPTAGRQSQTPGQE